MIWTDKDIVEWHKKTFPDVDLGSQIKKAEEEIHEYITAVVNEEPQEIIEEELADIYIVLLVLKNRFGLKIINSFLPSRGKLELAIHHKMDKNAKRTWIKVNGVYRHKVLDNM